MMQHDIKFTDHIIDCLKSKLLSSGLATTNLASGKLYQSQVVLAKISYNTTS